MALLDMAKTLQTQFFRRIHLESTVMGDRELQQQIQFSLNGQLALF